MQESSNHYSKKLLERAEKLEQAEKHYLMPVFSPRLVNLPRLAHGFFTRRGGVSEGIYESLNCSFSSHDDRNKIETNRRRAVGFLNLPLAQLLTPKQSHSATVITLTAEPSADKQYEGDAVVTNVQNLAIGVLTADCGTVLLADPKAAIIGAAHAGWKGALNGILQNTIDAMLKLGAKAENIIAASGPSIGPEHYEVGEEFRSEFIAKDAAYGRYFTPFSGARHNLPNRDPNAPTYHCDLWAFIHDRLTEKGVQADDLHICTYADKERFFSFRRATHLGETDYGRQISAICLR